MEIRELKYYKWVFDKDEVTLVNKKDDKHFILSMPMVDSLCRACISFRNRYRIEQIAKWKKYLKNIKEIDKKRIKILREEINGNKNNK